MMRAAVLLALLLLAPPAFAGSHRTYTRNPSGGHRSTYCTTCLRDSRGRIRRSSSVRMQFLRSHGLTRTPPGFQVDHIKSLACGGSDTISNLQLIGGAQLRSKEATERRCR